MHDNEVGRRFETKWALAALEETPTKEFIETAAAFGEHWSGLLGEVRDAHFKMRGMTPAMVDHAMNNMSLDTSHRHGSIGTKA